MAKKTREFRCPPKDQVNRFCFLEEKSGPMHKMINVISFRKLKKNDCTRLECQMTQAEENVLLDEPSVRRQQMSCICISFVNSSLFHDSTNGDLNTIDY